jgi:hypothetical protein
MSKVKSPVAAASLVPLITILGRRHDSFERIEVTQYESLVIPPAGAVLRVQDGDTMSTWKVTHHVFTMIAGRSEQTVDVYCSQYSSKKVDVEELILNIEAFDESLEEDEEKEE